MDDLLRALSNVHRRRLLVDLLDYTPQRGATNVPEDVHAGEKDLETLQLELYHSHLPRLEEAGFISWNQDTHEVVQGPRFDEIRPVIEFMRDNDDELPDEWLSAEHTRPRSGRFTMAESNS